VRPENIRAKLLGVMLADVIIEVAHLTYNASRGRKIVAECIQQLERRTIEIKPKKASSKYKKARYNS